MGLLNCANQAKKIQKESRTSNRLITFCKTWDPCVPSLSR